MPNINTLWRTYQNLIISAAILLFCAIGFITAVFPAVEKIQSLLSDTQQLTDDTKALTAKLTVLNALDESSLRQQLSAVISAVPTDKSLPTVFSTIEGLAAQSGVSVVSVDIEGDTALATASAAKQTPEEKMLGTRTIPFSATIEGTLDAIQHFIALAPQVRRLLRIRTFAITFPSDAKPVRISLEMDAFYQPSPTSLGKTGAAIVTLSDAEQSVISKVSQLPQVSGADMSLPPPLMGQMKPNPFAP